MRKWENLPVSMKNSSVRKYYNILQRKKISLFFKRVFDITFSIIGLIILSPIFILLAIMIKVDSTGPVFYRQERVTRYDKTFRIFKFRTMVQDADKKGALITSKNDNRITKVGKLIRKCRLDEIPQLINVLIGDMSFVGTRPEVRKYVDKYTAEMEATLLMRAGITSYASIYFKNEDELLSQGNTSKNIDNIYIQNILPKKMKHNLKYICNFNIITDVKICAKTVLEVFAKDSAINKNNRRGSKS